MVDLTYQASVQPEGLPGRAFPRLPDEVSPNAYGAGVGQSIEQASGELQRVHDQMTQQAQQTQLQSGHNQAQTVMGNLLQDPKSGAMYQQGQDSFGNRETYLPQFDQHMDQIAQGIADPKARAAFTTHVAPQLRNQFTEQLDTHALQQHKEFADKTDLDTIDIAGKTAAMNPNNPNIIASNKDSVDLTIDSMGLRHGWSQAQIDATKQEAFSRFHTNVLDSLLTNNKLPMAQHYLDAARSAGDMDPHTALQLQDMINSRIKEQQNEQKQGIADRYNDSMQAAEFGLKNPISVSRQELDILYPKDAQRHWDGLQSVAAAAAKAKEFDQMKPDEIQTVLDKAMPKEGGPEAAFKISAYNTLERAANQSYKARQQDPAQFAIDSGAGWKPLDFSNSANLFSQIRSRANTQGQVSEQSGVSTPLLTKDETSTFTKMLNSQAPAARMETLAGLRSTLFDQSYSSLMRQVMPNSPITAIAGTTADRPAKGMKPVWFDQRFAEDPGVGVRMMEGDAILKDKGEKGIKSSFPMPPEKDLQTQFLAAAGGTNNDLFRGRDQTMEAYYAAYKAVYAADANKAGISNGIIKPDMARQAAEDVLGHVTNYQHSSVVAPSGMDPTRFEGSVDRASKEALSAAGYDEKDISALRGYGIRELGDTLGTGRYVIINGNGDALQSKDRKGAVIIDLNQQRTGQPAPPKPKVAPIIGKGGSAISVS